MKPRWLFLLSLLYAFLATPVFATVHERNATPETVIYEAGKNLPAQIQVPEGADATVAEAVGHLRRVLSGMTGMEWKIVNYPREKTPDSGLVINDSLPAFPASGEEFPHQGYVITSDGKKIEIAAVAPMGIVHGTAAFARELDYLCRRSVKASHADAHRRMDIPESWQCSA